MTAGNLLPHAVACGAMTAENVLGERSAGPHAEPSSPGLTGAHPVISARADEPLALRPTEFTRSCRDYWVARLKRAMTTIELNAPRNLRGGFETRPYAHLAATRAFANTLVRHTLVRM